MIYLPSPRRFLLPSLILLALVVFYRSNLHVSGAIPSIVLYQHVPSAEGIRIQMASVSSKLLPFSNSSAASGRALEPNGDIPTNMEQMKTDSNLLQPILNPNLEVLFKCHSTPNKFTNHIRIPYAIRNISMVPPKSTGSETRTFFNPTMISLPYWSANQYLLVTRVVPVDNSIAQNVLCEANVCNADGVYSRGGDARRCTTEDTDLLGASGGLRCATPPIPLNVPPTPAEMCEGATAGYVDYPGFHDPRMFWSGKGEPLMMVNSLSRYSCLGLWLIDIRTLHKPLEKLLASSPEFPSMGALRSYPTLTEITRNPSTDRFPIEKNWLLFSSSNEHYVQYEISPHNGRTFAKLLGGGLTTTNLTDPLELPCLQDDDDEEKKWSSKWHQATNALRLVLCERDDTSCTPSPDNTVFFAVVHRKRNNAWNLPLRYERYFMVWSASPPFSMLGVSYHPILLSNETAFGWSATENWDDDPSALAAKRGLWPHSFTYTVSIAYAWGRQRDEAIWKSTGYLDDEVVLGIGIDDVGQGFATVPVKDILQCLRACPGRATAAYSDEEDDFT